MTTGSWEEHAAAAEAMGLDGRAAYETYEGGMRAAVEASRERRRVLATAVEEMTARSHVARLAKNSLHATRHGCTPTDDAQG